MPGSSNVNFSSADAYIRAALTGLTARQRAVAHNVANVDTPNFKASEVRFEDTLKSAISRRQPGQPVDQTVLSTAISRTTESGATSTRGDGNNVDIDREMEILGETNLTYSALTQVMTSRLSTLRGIITGR